MDEKGVVMEVIRKERCIVSKSEKRLKTIQDKNREWCTVFEYISLKGKVLSLWIIFKAKLQKKEWQIKLRELRRETGEEEPSHIYVSNND
jgi:hypothetical protein